MKNGKNIRLDYISLVNVISAVSVVILHTNGIFWQYSNRRWWITADIIESFFYYAVPCFFMITGATLLDYRNKYSTKEFFKKRIKKTVIPFLFWGIVAFVGTCISMGVSDRFHNPIYVIDDIINARIISIYWFFPALFSVYLCIPLFSAVRDDIKNEVFTYLALAGFIINSLIPFAIKAFQLDMVFPINIGVAAGVLLYVIVGWLISKNTISLKNEILIYCLSVVGFVIHAYYTYVISSEAGEVLRDYKGYTNLPCIIYSVGVFVFIKKRVSRIMNNEKIRILINKMSGYTFGLYLIHWYILVFVRDYIYRDLLSIPEQSILFRLGAPLIIIPVCLTILFILKRIPIIKNIVP
ncbi:MAG: acyltransferase [Eubacterium sp.]|nr:acyltransferase [Eubacterium sp.]